MWCASEISLEVQQGLSGQHILRTLGKGKHRISIAMKKMGSYKCIRVCVLSEDLDEKSSVYILLHGKYSHLINSSVLFAGNSGSFPCKAVIALHRTWCITSINPSQILASWVARVYIPVV